MDFPTSRPAFACTASVTTIPTSRSRRTTRKTARQSLSTLEEQHASSPNLQFSTTDKNSLQAAFGEKWKLGQPFMVMIQPDGKIIYKTEGKSEHLRMRREVVKNLPDDRGLVRAWSNTGIPRCRSAALFRQPRLCGESSSYFLNDGSFQVREKCTTPLFERAYWPSPPSFRQTRKLNGRATAATQAVSGIPS